MAANTGFMQRFKGGVILSEKTLTKFGRGGGLMLGSGQLNNLVGTSYGNNVSAAGVGNGADTTEDTLFTFTLPANALLQIGSNLSITAFGTFASNTHSKTAKLYFGSELVSSGANTTGGSVIPWWLQLDVFKTGASTQIILGQLINGATHGGCTFQTGAETDTATITIKCTGQTGTSAASDVLCYVMQVQGLN
jgi:hypothetical protein